MNSITHKFSKKEIITVSVVALGYFVDVYDILLFSIVRTASLKGIGITNPADLTNIGLDLLNYQLFGMLIGGLVWGLIADKAGRRSVLFGSIFMYSIATLGNAFVDSIELYSAMRFIAGFGLSGELGVGIALIAETLKPKHRTIGTTIQAVFFVARLESY